MSRSLTEDDLSTSPRSGLSRPNNLGVIPFGAPFSEAEVETAMEADEALTFEPGEEGPDVSELGNEMVSLFVMGDDLKFIIVCDTYFHHF